MKPPKSSKSAAKGKPGTDTDTPSEMAHVHTVDLGIVERRHFIRPIPVADAVESDRDTDWDTFQALIEEKPKD